MAQKDLLEYWPAIGVLTHQFSQWKMNLVSKSWLRLPKVGADFSLPGQSKDSYHSPHLKNTRVLFFFFLAQSLITYGTVNLRPHLHHSLS